MRFVFRAFLAVGCLGGLSASGAFAQTQLVPRISYIMPMGGQAGTTIDLKVTGQDLAEVEGLHFSFPGVKTEIVNTTVAKIRPPARVSQVGIENLHIESPPQAIPHTQPHFTALRINGQDCWARDVAIDETMNSVRDGSRPRNVSAMSAPSTLETKCARNSSGSSGLHTIAIKLSAKSSSITTISPGLRVGTRIFPT